MEKPRKGNFLCSIFKSHPSPQVLRTCLDLHPSSPAEPPASPWPSPSLCCWPWGCSAPAPRVLWAASCLRATAIWKASRIGVRWRESLSCPVWGTGLTSDFLRPWWTGPGLRRQKPQLLCTSCSSWPSSSSAPRAPLQVGRRASWTDSSRAWSAAGGAGHVSEGGKDEGGKVDRTLASREWELQIGCEELLPANQCVSQRETIQLLCLGGCQRGN